MPRRSCGPAELDTKQTGAPVRRGPAREKSAGARAGPRRRGRQCGGKRRAGHDGRRLGLRPGRAGGGRQWAPPRHRDGGDRPPHRRRGSGLAEAAMEATCGAGELAAATESRTGLGSDDNEEEDTELLEKKNEIGRASCRERV